MEVVEWGSRPPAPFIGDATTGVAGGTCKCDKDTDIKIRTKTVWGTAC